MQRFSERMGVRATTVSRCYLPILALAALGACEAKEEKQPSAAELENFIAEVNRADTVARDEAVQASRAKEEAVEQAHKERLEALD
jgi:hypothetical protein